MDSLENKSENNNEEMQDKVVEILGDDVKEIKPEEKTNPILDLKNLKKSASLEGFQAGQTKPLSDLEKAVSLISSQSEQKTREKKAETTKNIKLILGENLTSENDLGKKSSPAPRVETPNSQKEMIEKQSIQTKPENFPEKKQKKSFMKTVRTYQSDVVETMKKQKTSLTSMVIAEKKKKKKKGVSGKIKQEQRGGKALSIIITILIISVSGLAVYFIIKQKTAVSPTITELSVPSFILSDYTRELYLNRVRREDIISGLEKEKKEISIPLGDVLQLYLTVKDNSKQFVIKNTDGYKLLVMTESYFDGIEANAPPSLVRSLSPNFVIGYHSSLGNNPFLIFKVKSYDSAFAGMLKWEKTMYRDLAPVFVRNNSKIKLSDNKFEDIVIMNKDVRAILNDEGKIELAYSFPNPDTLVIVNNETTLQEMFRKITNFQLERRD